MINEEYFKRLKELIMNMRTTEAVSLTKDAISNGVSAIELLENGLSASIFEVWDKYCKGEAALSQVIMSLRIGLQCQQVLKPNLPPAKGRAIIGTVGSSHDLGKGLIRDILILSNYDVHDIGVSLKPEQFAEEAKKIGNINLVLTTCMILAALPLLKNIGERLKEAGIRDKVKWMVGGFVVTSEYAKEIGAEGFGNSITQAPTVANKIMSGETCIMPTSFFALARS
jgi:methanogenic corrinoid protein MtbC1